MKEISIFDRWQRFMTLYESKLQEIKADKSLNPEARLKRTVELQRRIVAGIDAIEESLRGKEETSEPESPGENLAEGGN